MTWTPGIGRRAVTTTDVDAPLASGTIAARRPDGSSVRATTLLQFATLVIAPLLLTAALLHDLVGNGFALDFHGQYWPAARRLLDGLSPYDLGWQDIQRDIAFPYGAVPALLFVPFGLIPHGVASALFTALCIGAVPLTLRLLGVRDWRVYGIAFLWVPVIAGWMYANVSLLLGLGIALMWRYRDRAFVAGLLVALLVSIKLFVWPLAIWLLGTRRYAALGYAALSGLALNLAAWMVVGFDQIGPYVKLLGLVTEREEPRSFTLVSVALDFGASRTAAYALTLGLAAIVGGACFVLARRGREQHALLLCIAVGFLATPVTWPHYFALLIVPLALLRPKLSLLWAVPVAILPIALAADAAGVHGIATFVAVFAAMIVAALWSAPLERPPASRLETA